MQQQSNYEGIIPILEKIDREGVAAFDSIIELAWYLKSLKMGVPAYGIMTELMVGERHYHNDHQRKAVIALIKMLDEPLDYQRRKILIREAVHKWPDNIELHDIAGAEAQEEGDLEKARDLYVKALELAKEQGSPLQLRELMERVAYLKEELGAEKRVAFNGRTEDVLARLPRISRWVETNKVRLILKRSEKYKNLIEMCTAGRVIWIETQQEFMIEAATGRTKIVTPRDWDALPKIEDTWAPPLQRDAWKKLAKIKDSVAPTARLYKVTEKIPIGIQGEIIQLGQSTDEKIAGATDLTELTPEEQVGLVFLFRRIEIEGDDWLGNIADEMFEPEYRGTKKCQDCPP